MGKTRALNAVSVISAPPNNLMIQSKVRPFSSNGSQIQMYPNTNKACGDTTHKKQGKMVVECAKSQTHLFIKEKLITDSKNEILPISSNLNSLLHIL